MGKIGGSFRIYIELYQHDSWAISVQNKQMLYYNVQYDFKLSMTYFCITYHVVCINFKLLIIWKQLYKIGMSALILCHF